MNCLVIHHSYDQSDSNLTYIYSSLFFFHWILSFFFQIFYFSATAPPIGRMGHSDILVGNKIVYFGGTNGKQCFSDLWVFDTATMTWLRPRTAGRPPTKSKKKKKRRREEEKKKKKRTKKKRIEKIYSINFSLFTFFFYIFFLFYF